MSRITKWIIGIIGIPALVGALAFGFSLGILKATPWLYNTFGKNVSLEQNLQNTPKKKDTPQVEHSEDPFDVLGTFGDSAGLFNAVFSGLAFAAVVLTFIWQWNKEDEKDKQTKKAQFESNFFNMTTMLDNIVANLTISSNIEIMNLTDVDLKGLYGENNLQPDGIDILNKKFGDKLIKGRAIFKYLYSERESETGIRGIKQAIENGLEQEQIQETFYDAALDHYFTYLYRILIYIDNSNLLKNEERQGYASILRAQLSGYELLVWFYNSLTFADNNKVKSLIEKYAMFNNLRWKLLANDSHYERYEKIFTGDNYTDDTCTKEEYAIGAFRSMAIEGVKHKTYTPCGSFELRYVRKKCVSEDCPLENN